MAEHLLVLPPGMDSMMAARVQALAYPGMLYRCCRCQRQGRLSQAPPVTIELHILPGPQQHVVKLMHVSCGAGGVIRHSPTSGPMTAPEDGVQTYALPALLSAPWSRQPWPGLLVEIQALGQVMLPAGEGTDLAASALLAAGLQPVSALAAPPEPPHPGWRVLLPGPDQPGSIRGPDGLTLYEPLAPCTFPSGWLPAVTQRGGLCAVYHLTQVGLATNLAGQPPEVAHQILTDAAQHGRVLGVIAYVPGGTNTR
jgi:hypothetical protein